jgi:hypothetical protein
MESIAHHILHLSRLDISWFRNSNFDLILTLGVLALALLLGSIGLISETCFHWVLFIDIWFLAHLHLAAMYTRLVFDRYSFEHYRFLIIGLPPIVLIITAMIVWFTQSFVLITGYYLWQTWHYTRQSYGISRAVGNGQNLLIHDYTPYIIFLFPISGLLYRAYQSSDVFYGWPIVLPSVPKWLFLTVILLSFVILLVWFVQRIKLINTHYQSSKGLFTHTLFVFSHVIITMTSYVWVEEITQGWLFINVWHNAQYLVFVWAYQSKQLKGSVSWHAPLLSTIFHSKNIYMYLGVCLGLGTLFYWLVGVLTYALETYIVSVVLIVHMTINFHHYLVDAKIWKRS